MKAAQRERCIVCGKAVRTEREGKVHDKCYTPAFVMSIHDGDDE